MFPLLAAQNSMYLFERLNLNNPEVSPTVYHHTFAMDVEGEFDSKTLIQALQILVARHEAMRSKITRTDKAFLDPLPVETFADPNQIPFIERKMYDQSIPPIQDLLKSLESTDAKKIVTQPFDFEKGPLWRCARFQYSKEKSQLLFVFHHMIMDIGSQNIFINDLSKIYNTLRSGQRLELPPHHINQPLLENTEEKENKLAFWKENLDDLTVLKIKPDLPPQKAFHFKGDREYFHIDAQTVQELENIAKELTASAKDVKVSLPSLFLASFYALLYRYTGESDICLGLVSANRRGYAKPVDDVINSFVNSIPLRIKLDGNMSLATLAMQIAKEMKVVLQNQLPLDIIVREALSAKTKSSTSVASPFNVLFNFNKEKSKLSLDETFASKPVELNLGNAKFENFGINFDMNSDGSCDGFIEFNSDLYLNSRIKNVINHLQAICQSFQSNPNEQLAHLPILSTTEMKLLSAFHGHNKKVIPEDFIQDIFTRLTKQLPNKAAIVFHNEDGSASSISYKKLAMLVDNLATYLQTIAVGTEPTIGISLNRSIKSVIAFLAILKAGCVAVPLESTVEDKMDMNSPLSHKIEDSLIRTIIVDNHTENNFSALKEDHRGLTTINLDDDTYLGTIKELNLKFKEPKLKQNNLAYIMYTSGTTGEPKGVMIEHSGLTNLIYALKGIDSPDDPKILCTARFDFDSSIFDILAWLAKGGTLHILNEAQRLSQKVQEQVIQKFKLNFATFLPDNLNNHDPEKVPSLKYVISMGAMANKDSLNNWRRHGCNINNGFGPTEASIAESINPYEEEKSADDIGKPLLNTDMFIVDENLNECPIGVPGEILIAGPNIARKYVNREELSKQKFVELYYDQEKHLFSKLEPQQDISCEENSHPVFKKRKVQNDRSMDVNSNSTPKPTIRVYRTGDIGRYIMAPDGTVSIEIFGRKDRQIKLRGARVEIDGIESILKKHPRIANVHIMLNEQKDGLIAYVVTKVGEKINKNEIDKYLAYTSVIPVGWPKHVIDIPDLPFTKNGKVETKLLPPIDKNDAINLPQTPVQNIICQILASILHINLVDTCKSLSELGCDSVDATTLETRLNLLQMNKPVTICDFKKEMTVRDLEALIYPRLINPPTRFNQQQNAPASITPGALFTPPPVKPNNLIFTNLYPFNTQTTTPSYGLGKK